MIFQTTPEEVLKLEAIVPEMLLAGVDADLVAKAAEVGRQDQGMYDLIVLWQEFSDPKERALTIKEIQGVIKDYQELWS